jgi:hypothetical protein
MISNSGYRFFVEAESYIMRYVEWTKDSREAIDNLVAELKEAVHVANQNSTF